MYTVKCDCVIHVPGQIRLIGLNFVLCVYQVYKATQNIITVNSEIFVRVYFRKTSNMRSFVKRKPPRNDEITLSVTDIGKSCLSREILTSLICLLRYSRK